MSLSCKALALATLCATQLLLGCTPSAEEETDPFLVKVPSDLEHPTNLAGTWVEAKGAQILALDADGKALLKNKAVIGAQGVSQTMNTETNAQWGTKDGKFYFHSFPNNGASLEYELSSTENKMTLSQKGSKSKLIYIKSSK